MEKATRSLESAPTREADRDPGWMPRAPASLKRRRPTVRRLASSPARSSARSSATAGRRSLQIGDGVIVFDGRGGLRARVLAGQRRVREHHPVPDRRRLPRAPADRDRRPGRSPSWPSSPTASRCSPWTSAQAQVHDRFFAPLFRTLQNGPDEETLRASLLEFMDSKRVNDRTDDDKTLLLATRSTTDVPPSLPDPTA